jgi:hypothetical protein
MRKGALVKALLMGAAMLMMAGHWAYAQDATQAPPGAAAQTSPAGRATPPAVDSRRDDIRMVESVLVKALRNGADNLARQLQMSEPGSTFVAGEGRARGFALDGYGFFFDVDVPGMRASVVWSAQMLSLAQQRERLKQYIETRPDGPGRVFAQGELARLEQLTGAVASPVANPAPGKVSAATVDPVPAPPPDPNELYTESVKTALIDAMLKYSNALRIAPDEWLTVAARDSDGPLLPGQIDDASTIVIRIKGRDLAAFQSGKLTRDEVMKKVEVREF